MTALRIGVLFPLGGHWRWGADCVDAVHAALAAARHRDVTGEVILDVRDVADPDRAGFEAERAIDGGARLLLGTVFSAPALAASAVARQRGVAYWECVAAASELTRRGHPALFRFNTTAERYGRAAAAFIAAHVGTGARVVVAEQDEPFSRSIVAGLVGALSEHGMELAARVGFATHEADHVAVVDALRAHAADVAVLSALGSNVGALWEAVLTRGKPARVLLGNGAWATRPVADGAVADLDGMFVVDTPHTASLREGVLTADGRRCLADLRAIVPDSGRSGPADADMTYVASRLLFEHVLPHADPSDLSGFAAAARAIDIPIGGTPNGYGMRSDDRGDNERAFAIVLQWQDGDRRVVFPDDVATARARIA